MEQSISKATMARYPIYLKALRKLKSEGVERIMSHELSELVDIKPTTIRRDFSLLGALGRQGFGYEVDFLINIFNEQLGMLQDVNIILIGAGNIGRALMKYNKWHYTVGEIACAFDINEDRQGVRFEVPVYHINELKEKMPKGCKIAIVAVSQDAAQDVVDRLVDAGIIGIIDFTHEHITVPKGVIVKHVDIVSSIQEIIFETSVK